MEDKVPFELWLKILSYLPRTYQRKMIGVSRALFEYALDEVFRELRLVSDDERTLFMTTRLQNTDIAKRVTRIMIRPTSVLDTMPSPVEEESRSPQSGKNKFLRFLKSNQPKTDQAHDIEQKNPSDTLWSIAERNIKHCTNASELVIILDTKGSQLPRSFESFLRIWLPESILPKIRRLTIETTAHNLSKLILPMYQFSGSWTSLEHLDITIDPSHKSVVNYHLLHPFLESLKEKLISFTLSGHLLPNIANMLRFSPKFTKLRNFELHSIFNLQNVQQVEQFNQFLSRHSETLENIIINPQLRTGSASFSSSHLYIHWLGLIETQGHFSQLSLPRLRTLELRYDHRWINGPMHYRVVFPSLSTVAPNLTVLTITQAELSLDRVSELLTLLPRHQNGVSAIESINLSIDILSPELMDLLSDNLPSLQALKLRLSRYIVSSDLEQYMFYQIIRTRKYPSWKLGDLRIVASSSCCGTPHPNMLAMRAVAETLSNPPTLDTHYECQCDFL